MLDIFLNFGLAWISVFIALFLAIAYITRKSIIRFPSNREFFINANKKVRKYHKFIGAGLIITGLLHGIFSSDKLFSLNWGTALWVLSILLGISWMLRKKITGKKNWMYWHRILVACFAISIVVHVVDAGGIQIFKVINTGKNLQAIALEYQETAAPAVPDPTETPSAVAAPSDEPSALPSQSPTPETASANVYMDGTYTGEAQGYQPGLVVRVIIKDNEITSVEVTDHNEVNSRFWGVPVTYIPRWIVDEQSTEVDTVSGATFTSTGIINAVNDALRKALVNGEIPEDLPLPFGRSH